MPVTLSHQVLQSLELMERCTRYHQRQFARLIERLNKDPSAVTQAQCLRLCVEAVSVMVAAQNDLAGALRDQLGELVQQLPPPAPLLRSAA
jgi:hypothetical protein